MKVVIQRVLHSSVKVNNEIINKIGKGLLILVGISQNDSREDIDFITRKILNIKLFDNEEGKRWSASVTDKQYEILCVSQFTLCHTLKGNKLDFHHAMKPEESEKFYESFLDALKRQYHTDKIKNGKFGALMEVDLCNDGPVTIHLSSEKNVKT